ncbi:MAG: acylphosphatase [Deltaproteobacteria bacterium]|nr:acylphosphatase [Deltaproteobacteria bacterium]
MEKNVRAHVIISGRVQGVFFRMETLKAAQLYGVSGWVKNKADGTVEALFEGDKNSVDSILKWCRKGSPPAKVENAVVNWEDYTGEFDEFKITY